LPFGVPKKPQLLIEKQLQNTSHLLVQLPRSWSRVTLCAHYLEGLKSEEGSIRKEELIERSTRAVKSLQTAPFTHIFGRMPVGLRAEALGQL
jgi:hypothetical protein